MDLTAEFNRQIENLIKKDYLKLSGLTENNFNNIVNQLKAKVALLTPTEIDLEEGFLPFVVVVKSDLLPTSKAMSLVNKDGKEGITKLFPHQPTDFNVLSKVAIPPSKIYLLIDIDRGKDTLNLPPSLAIQKITQAGRLPLTIDEGVAIVTHYPEFLIKNNCFSLLASRHTGDQRVPAIWINSNKNPNLGWCWNGNPHTWLGSASCKSRIG